MGEYTEYVMAAYSIAAVVYGGLVVAWQLELKKMRLHLAEEAMQEGKHEHESK